jgi:hypothetical protein
VVDKFLAKQSTVEVGETCAGQVAPWVGLGCCAHVGWMIVVCPAAGCLYGNSCGLIDSPSALHALTAGGSPSADFASAPALLL